MATAKIRCITVDGAEISYLGGTKGIQIVSIKYIDPDGTYVIPAQVNNFPVMHFRKGFAENIHVKRLEFPETTNALILDEECFEDINGIETVVISSLLSYIPRGCFRHSSIKNIEFNDPSSLTEICSQAFAEMKYLSKFSWPSGCSAIPDMCFSESGLTEIYGIDGVTKVGGSAFSRCKLKKLRWPDKCDVIPEWCFSISPVEEIENISHVTNIENGAFYRCAELKKFDWPNGCLKIPRECFRDSGLNSIDFGDINLVSIEKEAFLGTKFTTLKVPETADLIHSSAFDCMKQLEEIEFTYAETQTTVPVNAFSSCSRLKKIIFNASTVKIGEARMFFYINSRRDLSEVVLDMKNVHEVIVQKNEDLDIFLEKIQMGFDTNLSIVPHNPEI